MLRRPPEAPARHKGARPRGCGVSPFVFSVYATFSTRRVHFNAGAGIGKESASARGGTKAVAGILISPQPPHGGASH